MRMSRRLGNYFQGGKAKPPLYTGEYTLTQIGEYVYMHLLSSGIMSLQFSGEYDLFVVGGGGQGGYARSLGEDYAMTAGGGGGGYTKTALSQKLDKVKPIAVTIGAGGSVYGLSGGTTAIGSLIEALGGSSILRSTAVNNRGANGGSGGGATYVSSSSRIGGAGGADGGNGEYRQASGGIGQGTTTRAFGEADNTLYAGGGGGGSGSSSYGSVSGGQGGGGAGGSTNATLQIGTPNTGGGGGGGVYNYGTARLGGIGGSGIAIIRWKGKL